MSWQETVLSKEEFFLLAKAHDYDYKYACEAQAKKSFEEGYRQALDDQNCKTCDGTGEVPVPAGDYPLSVRMRPCPDCKQ